MILGQAAVFGYRQQRCTSAWPENLRRKMERGEMAWENKLQS